MTSQVALLRGINVGSNRKFPMARQRALMAELGFEGVAVSISRAATSSLPTPGRRPRRADGPHARRTPSPPTWAGPYP